MNGRPRGNIFPDRGLRQGDTFSPFIFILCMEALVTLLNHVENHEKITGMRVARARTWCLTCYLLMMAFSSVRQNPVNLMK